MAETPPNRNPHSRGARTVTKILDSAARLFGNAGYRGATMNMVARAAGVSKGLLHYHFQSKEHLLIEAQRATFRQIHRRIAERVQRGDRGMPTALTGLDALWGALRDMHVWTPFMVETLSLASSDPAIRERLEEFYLENEQLLTRSIEEVFSSELDRLAVPPNRLTKLVRLAMHGLAVELAYARTPAELARIEVLYEDLRGLFEQVVLKPRFSETGDSPPQ